MDDDMTAQRQPQHRLRTQTQRVINRQTFDLKPKLLSKSGTNTRMSANHCTVESSAKHTATIIFLHGLGDTGKGWIDTIAQIRPPFAKCICPTAQVMPVSLNGGFPMPSWFDLFSLESDARVDEEGIKRATVLVHELIAKEERSGIAANRIVLGGFSQGGALALYAGLTYPKPLGGILGFSCWLPKHQQMLSLINDNKEVPVLQCKQFSSHGDSDPLVQTRWGQMTADVLSKTLTKYQFKIYKGMAHSSCPEELNDAKSFIAKCLSN
ncbi:unnamed protein product [Medioppia subpectinata]|uniref:palmitoyl-protein hydrolase n=1 Tax=Medioppia subpectinata TaxID=1979941 RepID=A0A7R9KPM1_9ACAR|nr:unnamed protein product [Medioppia subpectinata]CAG2107485.1 unnamed protein product [Medioppia subpectinata]